MTRELTPHDLALPKETVYFSLVLVISLIVWALLVVLIVPIIYGLIILVFIWFANGLLVARLRADGVKVDAGQLPELHQALSDVCTKLEIAVVPELFVIQSGGLLNAFATRHSGRHFVVLFSDLLEAYGPGSPETRFFLGHELGHIKRNHLIKFVLLLPGLLLPLLGNAYRRACEASCDRFGAFAAGDSAGAIRAMMVLAGGKEASRTMNPEAFAAQYDQMRGFFVSWYELISGYPTTSQRVAALLALREGYLPSRSPRHPLAYVFALFSFGGPGGGGSNLLMTIVVIGVLVGLLLPAVEAARQAARTAQCANNLYQIEQAKELAASALGAQPGDEIPAADVSRFIPGGLPALRCPDGGTYLLNPAGELPTCSLHGSRENMHPARERPGLGPNRFPGQRPPWPAIPQAR
jgi:Zn-dependent protease with chaperone function